MAVEILPLTSTSSFPDTSASFGALFMQPTASLKMFSSARRADKEASDENWIRENMEQNIHLEISWDWYYQKSSLISWILASFNSIQIQFLDASTLRTSLLSGATEAPAPMASPEISFRGWAKCWPEKTHIQFVQELTKFKQNGQMGNYNRRLRLPAPPKDTWRSQSRTKIR